MCMKMKTSKHPLYIVVWKDHVGDAGWKSEEEVKKEKYILAYSIGYLIHQDKECVKLCNTYTSDDGHGGLDLILKNCIVEMYEIDIIN